MRNWTIRTRLLAAFLGVLATSLLLAGAGALGMTVLRQGVESLYHEATMERAVFSDLDTALDRLTHTLTDYQATGNPAGRAGLAQDVAQIQLMLARLDPGLFQDAEERSLVAEVRALGTEIERLSREILRIADVSMDAEARVTAVTLRQRIDRAMELLHRALAISEHEMLAEIEDARATLWWSGIVGLGTVLLGLAGGVALAFRLSDRLSRPILAIAEQSRRMAGGDLSARVRIPAEGELGEAVTAFNAMAERLEAALAENARLYATIRDHAAKLEERVRERTRELAVALDRAEAASRAKAQFLATMSHELRTPLNAVLGFSEVLLSGGSGALAPKQERYLQLIHQGGERLLGLVTDLLDLAESGGELQPEPIPLGPFLAEVLGPLTLTAGAKQIRLTTTLEPGLSVVRADRQKLARLLNHLVANALRFTPAGGAVTVRARRVPGIAECGLRNAEFPATETVPQSPIRSPQSAIGDFLEIAVTDTGIGLAPEDRERIFQAFEQVDGSDTRRYEGAGLGLALTRHLVELHGGRVWAESAGPGQGSRFVVRIPQGATAEPTPPPVAAGETPVREAPDSAGQERDGSLREPPEAAGPGGAFRESLPPIGSRREETGS
jgi:signal transduction histidine kinase